MSRSVSVNIHLRDSNSGVWSGDTPHDPASHRVRPIGLTGCIKPPSQQAREHAPIITEFGKEDVQHMIPSSFTGYGSASDSIASDRTAVLGLLDEHSVVCRSISIGRIPALLSSRCRQRGESDRAHFCCKERGLAGADESDHSVETLEMLTAVCILLPVHCLQQLRGIDQSCGGRTPKP